MSKSKLEKEEEDKPQPRVEIEKVSPTDTGKKPGTEAAPSAPAPEDDTSQATVIMQAPSAFEQLVEKILKKHKI